MILTLDPEAWAGRWIAVDSGGQVLAAADSFESLYERIVDEQIAGAEIFRVPAADDPLVHGFG